MLVRNDNEIRITNVIKITCWCELLTFFVTWTRFVRFSIQRAIKLVFLFHKSRSAHWFARWGLFQPLKDFYNRIDQLLSFCAKVNENVVERHEISLELIKRSRVSPNNGTEKQTNLDNQRRSISARLCFVSFFFSASSSKIVVSRRSQHK